MDNIEVNATIFLKIHPISKPAQRLDCPVSLAKGSTNNNIIGHSSLRTILNRIVDAKNKPLVDFTSSLDASKNYSELKNKSCPAFILGKFFPPRKDDNCEIYVPLLGFDIDSLEDEFNTRLTLEDCKNCPYVFLAYPSPSRKGLRLFVWCNSTPDNHKLVYESVCEMLSKALRIKTDKAVRKDLKAQGIIESKKINELLKQTEHIDTSTKNISRLWFYTHIGKEDIYLNEDSEVFNPNLIKQEEKRPKRPQTLLNPTVPLTQTEKVRLCAKMAAQRNILAGRNNGIFSMACLMVEHGVSENEIIKYCLTLEEIDFPESEIIKTVKSAVKRAEKNKYSDAQLMVWRSMAEGAKTNTTKRTLPKSKTQKKAINQVEDDQAEEVEKVDEKLKGFEPLDLEDIDALEAHFKDKNLSIYLKIKPYVLTKYDFRQNVISNDIEYKLKEADQPFRELTEHDIECEILDFGLKGSVDKPLMTLLRSTLYVHRFNPIEYYFSELPRWDNSQPDHITNFANYVIAKDQEWFNYQFKKMLVRSVACSLNYTPFNKQCFTFLGAQNDGKTTFLRFLCPPKLKRYYKENIDITNKDGSIALTQNMFINFEELDAMKKIELNKIKAMFTVDKIKVRPPYGKRPLNFPRVCNFLASSNREEILTDETGNIRWLVFEILGIKHDNGGKSGYNQNVDIDLVWAQAFQLLKSGFKYNLTAKDIAKSEYNNKSYQQTTVEMEWIQKMYSPGESMDEESTFVMASDILREILIQSKHSRLNLTNVGKALRFLGFTKSQYRIGTEKNPRRGYWVKSNIVKIE